MDLGLCHPVAGNDEVHIGQLLGPFRLNGEGPVRMGDDAEVFQAFPGPHFHPDAPGDAAHPPPVLVLQIGPVTPAEDFQRDEIVPGLHLLRDVETGVQLAVFAVADLFPVDPDSHIGDG